ncbi:MAG: alpha/beta hydrolase [Halorientalis sp.]
MDVERHAQDFESEGTRCAGWLYEPQGVEDPPVVVMAHGFGGEREARLPAFAERFAAAGLAAFVFDYRGFGDSDGDPPHVVSGPRRVTDYEAALAHVRSLDGVDSDRVGLWGTSGDTSSRSPRTTGTSTPSSRRSRSPTGSGTHSTWSDAVGWTTSGVRP